MKLGQMIRLSKSCLGDAEKRAVMGVLDREYLGMGAEVQQFEQALTDFFGRPALCVVNGTAALQLALEALGVGPGHEVLVPSLTYVASFQAISATGARPVACDVDVETLTLDCRDAEQRVTPFTRAVMPVHYAGGVGSLGAVRAFAERHRLRMVEDAAHAFGTVHRGRRVGGFGDIACFSFDGIKNITSGEGGCIVTDDPDVLSWVRDARLLGVESDTAKRYAGQRSWEFDVKAQGWRYHMSNIMAAIGIEQLKRLPTLAERRRRLARRYDDALAKCMRIVRLPLDYACVVPHIYVIRIKGLSRRGDIRERLLSFGIQTGTHYQPNHTLSFYRDDAALPLPVTDMVAPQMLSLPLHPDLADEDVDFVCAKLLGILDEY
jgi:dTDP-4-amino-4,6-dideoxygalactose transaminase